MDDDILSRDAVINIRGDFSFRQTRGKIMKTKRHRQREYIHRLKTGRVNNPTHGNNHVSGSVMKRRPWDIKPHGDHKK